MVVIASSLLSASLLATVCMMLATSSSNFCQSLRLMAEGHLIPCCGTTLFGLEDSGVWRDWALWGASHQVQGLCIASHSPAPNISFSSDGPLFHADSSTACHGRMSYLWSYSLHWSLTLTLLGISLACWGAFSRKLQTRELTHPTLRAVFLSRHL